MEKLTVVLFQELLRPFRKKFALPFLKKEKLKAAQKMNFIFHFTKLSVEYRFTRIINSSFFQFRLLFPGTAGARISKTETQLKFRFCKARSAAVQSAFIFRKTKTKHFIVYRFMIKNRSGHRSHSVFL